MVVLVVHTVEVGRSRSVDIRLGGIRLAAVADMPPEVVRMIQAVVLAVGRMAVDRMAADRTAVGYMEAAAAGDSEDTAAGQSCVAKDRLSMDFDRKATVRVADLYLAALHSFVEGHLRSMLHWSWEVDMTL